MRKFMAAVLGVVAAAGLMTGTATADKPPRDPDRNVVQDPGFVRFTRPCGTTYSIVFGRTAANAGRDSAGTCAGHVWMRVLGDSWGDWVHSGTTVRRTSPNGKFRQAQIKGCDESYCVTYNVHP